MRQVGFRGEEESRNPESGHRVKRLVSKLLLFLLLGAIINIAVAWGTIFHFPPEYANMSKLSDEQSAEILRPVFLNAPMAAKDAHGSQHRQFGSAWIFVDWANEEINLAADPNGFLQIEIRESGLPMTSFRGFRTWDGRNKISTKSGCVTIPNGLISSYGWRQAIAFLPLRPVWPGFVVNTILFASVFWILFATPFALRRWWRARRGLCAKCAYPIGASDTCTECGRSMKRTIKSEEAQVV